VNESLGNIPDVWMRAWITGNQHIIFPQQWFFHKT
jgi:hypothetical protein